MCFQCQIPVVFHSTRALSCIRKTTRGKRQKVASEQIVAAALIKNVSVTQLTPPQLISFRKGKSVGRTAAGGIYHLYAQNRPYNFGHVLPIWNFCEKTKKSPRESEVAFRLLLDNL